MDFIKAALFSSLVLGCGVKTAPRSSIIETRPVIPFKEKVPAKAENKNKKELESKPEKGDPNDGQEH